GESGIAQDRLECPVCQARGPQVFRYFDGRYCFDVERARQLARDGRQAVELAPDDVRFIVETYSVHAQHVRHVDVAEPGIIANFCHPTGQGEAINGHRLIDGHHRAARCLELGIPFFAYLLSADETRSVLLDSAQAAGSPAADEALDPRERNRRAWNRM